jgi:hypothetical protein
VRQRVQRTADGGKLERAAQADLGGVGEPLLGAALGLDVEAGQRLVPEGRSVAKVGHGLERHPEGIAGQGGEHAVARRLAGRRLEVRARRARTGCLRRGRAAPA